MQKDIKHRYHQIRNKIINEQIDSVDALLPKKGALNMIADVILMMEYFIKCDRMNVHSLPTCFRRKII